MKRILNITLIVFCLSIILVGCNRSNQNIEDKNTDIKNQTETKYEDENFIKVMENVYVDYINDIYLDTERYLGNTIEIEGMFNKEVDENGKEHYYVYRLTQNESSKECENEEHNHNDDDNNHQEHEMIESKIGLEFSFDGELPKEKDWIKVVGKLKIKDKSIILDSADVEIMKERGLEKVKALY